MLPLGRRHRLRHGLCGLDVNAYVKACVPDAVQREAMHRRSGTVPSSAFRNGPGSRSRCLLGRDDNKGVPAICGDALSFFP